MPETSATPVIPVNKIPQAYQWLAKEPGPKMLLEALSHFGELEAKGPDNNPDITGWAKEIGGSVADVYKADEIPWCGLFMAICAKRAGYDLPKDPLWALNWSTFGTSQPTAMLGDVLTFIRKTNTGAKAGHVSMYVGEDEAAYHVLGGNQSDCVCITRIDKSRLYAIRRAAFKIGQPANVRQVFLNATGKLSNNEA
ncbi:TIGR02594 family protein [Flavisolibacter ginsenosidimutans]|uniref:TIGR02594 family protein n=1 Tax=Flavisolibacter ginsenosidimutans TaxID=661481 RepID=A0A5B8UKT6_9BACT|nr:TIGR02594 family protein [Flavisolibacter ginsenosidimutans]QEC56799.1 TIGR02594 family protein [Flavisolibacter ginsenosidimutans]